MPSPVARIIPQYDKAGSVAASGYWMKGYIPGTDTPVMMFTDSTTGTPLAKAELNSQGYPNTAGGDLFIPHFSQPYDIWLFPTEAEADANDFSQAVMLADNINPIEANLFFDSIASMIGSGTTAGAIVDTQSYRTGWEATLGGPSGAASYSCITRSQYDTVRGNALGPDNATNGSGLIDHLDTGTGNVYLLTVDQPSVRQCGAYGDDTNTDNIYFAAMETYFTETYITPGNYRIDTESATVTLINNLIFETSAILIIHRDSGTNQLDIRGDLDAPSSQIFDLSNIVTTRTAWDALYFGGTGQGELPLTFGFGSTTYNAFTQVPVNALSPQHFGAVGIPGTDDTLPVQICWDMHKAVRHVTNYDVTQVVLRGNELIIDFNGFKLLGVPDGVDFSSVLELKCGFSRLNNLRVDAQKSQFYQTGIHWYTNDLNLFFPAFNTIDGLFLENCYLGLCIGGLPGQIVFGGQADIVAEPLAIDAPLSESTVTGMKTITCLGGIFGNQPNGKVRFANCTMTMPTIAGYSAPAGGRATLPLGNYSLLATDYPGTSMGFSSCNIVSTDTSKTIPLITMRGGELSFHSCDLESETQIRIKTYTGTFASNGSTHAGQDYFAESMLRIDAPSNFGFNFGLDDPVFVIEGKAIGTIDLGKCRPAAQSGAHSNRTAPFMMVTDTFSGLDAGASKAEIITASTIYSNPYIMIRMTDMLFRDFAWQSVSNQLVGITQGLPNVHIRGTTFTGTNAIDATPPADDPAFTSVVTQAVQSNRTDSPYVGAVDLTGKTVGAAVTSGTTGGWTVVTTGGVGAQVDGQIGISDGPVVIGDDITDLTPDRYDNAIQLTSGTNGGGGTCRITSPSVACGPGLAYMPSFFIKTPEASPGAFNFICRLESYDHGGVKLSEEDGVTAFENQLNDDWTHVTCAIETNKNATSLRIVFFVENGCTVHLTGIN